MRGIRKRVRDLRNNEIHITPRFREQDVSVYFGDLLGRILPCQGEQIVIFPLTTDHLATMYQSLNFLDTTLAHDHPVFTGILRVALEKTKMRSDQMILRLYSMGLIFLPLTAVTGCFSENFKTPRDGDEDHLNPDGTPAGFHWFGIVLVFVSF